ncbi:MAG: phenylacetate--CoA ligase [Planctomycetaceae bacterium]|jgi:phenylacetate-CoA ligase|nr:phenylacetate--CoA ligase [Planctomycetaceae bacterium]
MPHYPYKPFIWDKSETLSRDEIRAIQFVRLRETIRRCMSIPFYRNKFDELDLRPESIKSVDDIVKLPLTTKSDLRDNYPFGFLAVPRESVVRYHGSTGTTGKPTIIAYTHSDLELWSNLCARFLVSGGLQPYHTVQVAFGYGLFTGGFGLHYGIERVGAAVVPAAAGNTKRQIMLLKDMQSDALVCTPSYALTIAEAIKTDKILASEISLKLAFLGGEPWTESMREALETAIDIRSTNNYGLSEVMGPGVSGECQERSGMHFQEDHFIVECIDPHTLQPVPEGQQGELVISSISREAMPVLRYRTRDIAVLYSGRCDCGRETLRMGRVIGRSDDMLIIRGVNIFPSQIEEALLSIEGAAPHYQLILERPKTLDEVRVRVELDKNLLSDKMIDMIQLKSRIEDAIHQITGLHLQVELLPPMTLERYEGKAKRVIDNRNIVTNNQ